MLRGRGVVKSLLVVVVVSGLAVVTAHAAAGSPQQARSDKGPPPSAHGNHWPSVLPAQSLPKATDPNICGPWSDLQSEPMQILEAVHGSFEGCLKVGSDWVILTSHSNSPGEVGVLPCHGNSVCLDGTQPHDLASFRWESVPVGISLSVLGQDGSRILLAVGTGDLVFDVARNSFGPLQHD